VAAVTISYTNKGGHEGYKGTIQAPENTNVMFIEPVRIPHQIVILTLREPIQAFKGAIFGFERFWSAQWTQKSVTGGCDFLHKEKPVCGGGRGYGKHRDEGKAPGLPLEEPVSSPQISPGSQED
jgi:hypothetical protein